MAERIARPGPPDRAASTREAYRDALTDLMALDEGVVCLDTDTGLFTGQEFGVAKARYLNVGIAEQTAMGLAAGLARDGRRPWVNTMASFAATRALEAVKIDIACNGLPVRIAATHAGLAAGHLGPTHHALEDLAIMRTFPGMTVLVPGDPAQTAHLVGQADGLPGPVYLRLGRKAVPPPPPAAEPAALGRLQPLRHGTDAAIVACGPHPVLAACTAAQTLAADGIGTTVLNAHTVKPFDHVTLCEAAANVSLVMTVEEHWTGGGLGGAVAEVLTEHMPRRLVRVGVPDAFADVSGDQEYQLARYGVDADTIVRRMKGALRGRGPSGAERTQEARAR